MRRACARLSARLARAASLPIALVMGLWAPSSPATAQDMACWDGPRIFHSGPPPALLANRVRLTPAPAAAVPPGTGAQAPPAGELMPAPVGDARLWLRNPDTLQPGPWDAGLTVQTTEGGRHELQVSGLAGPLQPRWVSDRLVFLRIVWGRTTFSDLLLDAQTGTLRVHELAQDGSHALAQFKASCRGEACRCPLAPADGGPVPAAVPGPSALIGLLQLPTVFGPPEQGCIVAAAHPRPVRVFGRPDEAAAHRLLQRLEDFAYREYTYEGAAAVVHAQRPGWYRIGLRGPGPSKGWVRAAEAGPFLPIAELLRSHPAHLNGHWPGELWAAPGVGRRAAAGPGVAGGRPGAVGAGRAGGKAPADAPVQPVRVLGSQALGQGLWLRVETLTGDGCDGAEPRVVDQGWIPAYADRGQLVAGYHSRGC